MKEELISATLLRAFKAIDPNYKIQECGTDSVYVYCDGVKIRVSNHMKKHFDVSSGCDVLILKPIYSKHYLISLDKSLFYAELPIEKMKEIIKGIAFNKKTFFPLMKSELNEEENFDIPKNIVTPHDVALYKKYADCADICEIKDVPEFANMVKTAYAQAGVEYTKQAYTTYYKKHMSYKELVAEIENTVEKK